jgi:hypothetical protein
MPPLCLDLFTQCAFHPANSICQTDFASSVTMPRRTLINRSLRWQLMGVVLTILLLGGCGTPERDREVEQCHLDFGVPTDGCAGWFGNTANWSVIEGDGVATQWGNTPWGLMVEPYACTEDVMLSYYNNHDEDFLLVCGLLANSSFLTQRPWGRVCVDGKLLCERGEDKCSCP